MKVEFLSSNRKAMANLLKVVEITKVSDRPPSDHDLAVLASMKDAQTLEFARTKSKRKATDAAKKIYKENWVDETNFEWKYVHGLLNKIIVETGKNGNPVVKKLGKGNMYYEIISQENYLITCLEAMDRHQARLKDIGKWPGPGHDIDQDFLNELARLMRDEDHLNVNASRVMPALLTKNPVGEVPDDDDDEEEPPAGVESPFVGDSPSNSDVEEDYSPAEVRAHFVKYVKQQDELVDFVKSSATKALEQGDDLLQSSKDTKAQLLAASKETEAEVLQSSKDTKAQLLAASKETEANLLQSKASTEDKVLQSQKDTEAALASNTKGIMDVLCKALDGHKDVGERLALMMTPGGAHVKKSKCLLPSTLADGDHDSLKRKLFSIEESDLESVAEDPDEDADPVTPPPTKKRAKTATSAGRGASTGTGRVTRSNGSATARTPPTKESMKTKKAGSSTKKAASSTKKAASSTKKKEIPSDRKPPRPKETKKEIHERIKKAAAEEKAKMVAAKADTKKAAKGK